MKTIVIASHTHWDREWHHTYQQFRWRLVRVMDDLLAMQNGDDPFPCFTLDGQTILLHDYTEMRPHRLSEIVKELHKGRLLTGPWYVQPDEFLVSGEALVRNLALGLRDCAEWAGPAGTMLVGYLLDQFGHCSQMPQILRGCGIESAVFWRGYAPPSGDTPARPEFWWQAPDGSRVLAVHLPMTYANAARLPLQAGALAERLRSLWNQMNTQPLSDAILLMNGGDHQPVQSGLPAALARAAQELGDDFAIIHADVRVYLDIVRREALALPTVVGELRSSAHAPLLAGVTSTRVPLKQRNVEVQEALLRAAEPWAAWAAHILRTEYPHDALRLAWRYLLQNHPHDSICGCSIDQVHAEMGVRYDSAQQIALTVAEEAQLTLAQQIDLGAAGDTIVPGALAIVVFNAGDAPQTGPVTIVVPSLSDQSYTITDTAGDPVAWLWIDDAGSTIDETAVFEAPLSDIPDPDILLAQLDDSRLFGVGVQAISISVEDDALIGTVVLGEPPLLSHENIAQQTRAAFELAQAKAARRALLRVSRAQQRTVTVLARAVPPHGYTTMILTPTSAAVPSAAATLLDNSIENAFLHIEADRETGALRMTDRRSGMVYAGCHVFEDGGDCGDTYTYCPPQRDTLIDRPFVPPEISARVDSLGSVLTIQQTLRVPASLTPSRTARGRTRCEIPIVSTVRLWHDETRIDISVTVSNVARDHRLRVVNRVPFSARVVEAAGAFAVDVRPVLGQPTDEERARWASWPEDPSTTAPHSGFVVLRADGPREVAVGLAVCAAGLPEYEAIAATDETAIAITLLRSVGWLSRGDLATRREHAGPGLETSDAQCLGLHTFSYSLVLFAGDSTGGDVWQIAGQAQHALSAVVLAPVSGGTLARCASFCWVDTPCVTVTACKIVDDGSDLVIRMANLSRSPLHTTLHVGQAISRASTLTLLEEERSELHVSDDGRAIGIDFEPAEIVTIRCRRVP